MMVKTPDRREEASVAELKPGFIKYIRGLMEAVW